MRSAQPCRIAALWAAALAACASTNAQTITTTGSTLALRSSGALTGGTSWILGSNGFVGTYITLANAGTVTLAVSASGQTDAGVAPAMNIVVDDSKAAFSVGAATANYSSSVFLPAGTHFVRTELTNATTNRKLTIANFQVNGAGVSNSSTDANALAAANTYINNYRKGNATIALTGPGNIPLLAGASVPVNMARNAFNFGGTVSGVTINDSKDMLQTNPAVGTEANQFQQFINSYFNTIVGSNAGKWASNEPTQGNLTMQLVDRQLNYAQSHNIRSRMHNLIWGSGSLSGNQQPGWVNTLIASAAGGNATDKTILRNAIGSRINYYAGTNGNRAAKYIEMDVHNEALPNPSYWNIYNPTTAGASTLSIASIFNDVHSAAVAVGNPNLRLYLNEYNVLQFSANAYDSTGARSGSDQYANWYRNEVEAVKNAGGAVSGIGIQEYVSLTTTGSNAHSAATIQKALQNLSVEGLPLTMAEYGHGSGTTPADNASLGPAAMDTTMRMFYGNPLATTFMMWGWWDTSGNTPPAQMIITTPGNSTYTLTVLGQKWIDLMHEFSTHTTASVDANGAISFNGFYGDYNIGSQNLFTNLSLVKGTTSYMLALTTPPQWSMWNVSNAGAWGSSANWTTGGVANSMGQTAYFGGAGASRSIMVDGAKTVGMIAFNSVNSYTIGGSTITLQGFNNASGHVASVYVATGSHQIDAPIEPADNTTITVAPAGSTLTVTSLQPSSVSITKAGAGKMIANNIHATSLNITGGTLAIAPNGTSGGTSVVDSLTVAGSIDAWSALLDLSNNDVIVNATPIATIQNLIHGGYNHGTWNGLGITSTNAATIAADALNPHKTALGFANASSLGVTAFDGQSVSDSSTLIRYTLAGDANLDGAVNALDFNALAANYAGAAGIWRLGDFNYDASINSLDFDSLAINFNQSLAVPSGALGMLIPEPATMLIASLWLIAQRRRSVTR
jgi:GH35 family endo-1,4-beta-xylanase